AVMLSPGRGVYAQGTGFTYQGRLNSSGNPAGGSYDFRFKLFVDSFGNTQAGSTVLASGVPVTNGLFTVAIDFGAGMFTGTGYWLEVGVRTNGASSYTSLAPLQALTPSPYAIFANGAGSATTATTAASAATATTATTASAVGANGVNNVAIQNNAVTAGKIASGQLVKSLTAGANTLYDNVTLAAGNNVTLTPSGQTVTIAATGGQAVTSLNGLQGAVTLAGGNNVTITPSGQTLTVAASGGTQGWSLTGNAGTTAGSQFVGTTDSQPLELRVNGQRVLRLEPGITPNVIAGRADNSIASGVGASIGGGAANTIASGAGASFIGGGYGNTNQDSAYESVIGGGHKNTVAANAYYSVIPGGSYNTVAGPNSFAAGTQAAANHSGCFVWGDFSSSTTSTANNQFMARCTGGAIFYTSGGTSTGVGLASGGGSWGNLSDRNAKENFAAVDAKSMLEKVAEMPLTTWNYKAQDRKIRHIGPMAQDFYAAFGVGEDERHITTVDEDGVALAAIQGLNMKLQEKDVEIQALKGRLDKLERAMSSSVGNH
ncbi:MAG: tail fiber domain-containing protein, partial [Verrucomicrobiota bacterium]